jgi:(E)-4-hydroxy-3-methylbut-2-enyl-diphosphate synthase
MVREVEERVSSWPEPLRLAIMGCCVNGPGEAREADIGIAAGKNGGILFRKGKIIRKVKETDLVQTLIDEAQKLRAYP